MKTFEEIKNNNLCGEYFAITKSGKKYDATFTNDYGGVMFFCIPYDEIIIGYVPKSEE